eukprot:CAMPEP_0176369838 /NCGR_PEP_ID=MMETSP0126-20121128/23568_1 /TAXON_ID=141414 ORGANISM="Strombidinopsis acuminatum, Strain SPMC142" /NCGR_SAMPLE_ID=MMETSP0126 /ASSEMBLY_ACC=CAM_ASM_000229 /LENGTH=37 /DNA_ID= /DNA_START= /DNA_END= /DNA_ORIENTATION=
MFKEGGLEKIKSVTEFIDPSAEEQPDNEDGTPAEGDA